MKKQEQRFPKVVRKNKIASFIKQNGFANIPAIAETLVVSEITIRRDLIDLEKEGRVMRIHGGAVASRADNYATPPTESALNLRMQTHQSLKNKIAAQAHALIHPHTTVALDIGSTTYHLALKLCEEKYKNVLFFTNDLQIASLLGNNHCRVYIPGGKVNPSELSVYGNITHEQIKQFWFDIAFIGVSGITTAGCYDYSLEDAENKRLYINRSIQAVILCDSSKFNKVALSKVCDFTNVNTIVTDANPPPEIAAAMTKAGCQLSIAP